ncbi:MAG: exopolygalacturonase [Tannerella sp.]|jgi:polygalacturonase|nr:exopolygalacturonase [Tannerella sp.]
MNARYIAILLLCAACRPGAPAQELFPDGTPVSEWFRRDAPVDGMHTPDAHFRITDCGATNDSTLLQTETIQAVIDRAHREGGGVIVIPRGTFLSGALFFKPGTHLLLDEGAVLKGSDDISHFPIVTTRMEGQTLKYFAALVNADRVDGFTVSGRGAIDGNGLRYWKSFWLRREVNPNCTNMDELRPRLVYISNSRDVQLSGVTLRNSPFWTTHLYRCERVRLTHLAILSPAEPVRAPSTDALDIDACSDVLVSRCYISVNDDAIALKGGKGPEADRDENNGGNRNILIEDCRFGFCHSVLTCGSESIHSSNVVIRGCTVEQAQRICRLKMRPDTPQRYEHILIEDIAGSAGVLLDISPWTQFFDLKGHAPLPASPASHVTLRNIALNCRDFLHIEKSDRYVLSGFTLENLHIRADRATDIPHGVIRNLILKNVTVNGKKLPDT